MGLGAALIVGSAHAAPPNIVLLLVDDAAWMDFGVYGGEARTPTIDALAQRGVMFTRHHSTPFCAPTRASLLTGVDHHLAGVGTIREVLPASHRGRPGYTMAIPENVPTVAEALRDRGYRTYMSGKWHLGQADGQLPVDRGFDRGFALDASGADHWRQRSYLPYYRTAPWFEGRDPVALPGDFYSSRAIIDRMIHYLEAGSDENTPFFAYVAFLAIHIPVAAPRELTDHYVDTYAQGWEQLRRYRWQKARDLGLIPPDAALGPWPTTLRRWDDLSREEQQLAQMSMAVNAGMLEAMDRELARLVDYLEQRGQLGNTVFVMTSDNGPAGGDPWRTTTRFWLRMQGYHQDLATLGERDSYVAIGPEWAQAAAGPLALFKFHSGEGGVRVPLVMSGPGLPVGRRVDTFTVVTDIAPTLIDLVDASHPQNAVTAHATDSAKARAHTFPYSPADALDGTISEVEQAQLGVRGRSLLPLIRESTSAVRLQDDIWATETSGQIAVYQDSLKLVRALPPHGDGIWRLFDIDADPGETLDLSALRSLEAVQMREAYARYVQAVGVLALPEGYEVYRAIGLNILRRQWDFYGLPLTAGVLLGTGLVLVIVRRWRRG